MKQVGVICFIVILYYSGRMGVSLSDTVLDSNAEAIHFRILN